jgi:hypothetical protein
VPWPPVAERRPGRDLLRIRVLALEFFPVSFGEIDQGIGDRSHARIGGIPVKCLVIGAVETLELEVRQRGPLVLDPSAGLAANWPVMPIAARTASASVRMSWPAPGPAPRLPE